MALDPSIILQAGRGVTPLLSPTEIQDQQMQREIGTMKLSQLRQGMADDQSMRDIARNTAPEGLSSAYYKAGLVKPAQEAQKFQTEQAKAARDAEKAKYETALKQYEVLGQVLGTVKDQASYDAGRKQLQSMGIPTPNAPPQYDPNVVQQFQQQAMSAKDQVAQKWKEMEYTTPNANALLGAQTSRATNAANIANSQRTADMTDARAREFNATKVEENTLKREAKQETADMTKAGQVASFDTMLGTLDRLSKHPGLERSVGLMSKLPTMPGSDSANFQAELDTFQSQAFVPMVAQLKGMGALSDAEGRKLTQAVGALNPNMGEKAFRESVARITADMNAARARVVGNKDAAPGPVKGKLPTTRNVDVGGTQMQARQAPDGKFYVQQGGKWFEVKE
jgi:hypothetical protein